MALKQISYNDKLFELSYKILNQSANKSILFLHGWGSNKEIMENIFSKFFNDYKHIYLDMPGFGDSHTESVLNTTDYFKIIKEFLKKMNIKPDTIVGHSFGGKIATLLNPNLLVLLSSSGILVEKTPIVKIKIYIYKFLKSIGLGFLHPIFATKDVKNMASNMYETLKNVVDEDFTKIFKTFTNKTVIFWGENDTTTPIKSGIMINNLIKNSTLYTLSGDHYFFTKHQKFIEKKINNG
jgi:pimeloyl-ACP methyl ester carboxylesterase